MHNHIIPGIDDGSESVFESILMIHKLVEWGISKAIYTPHIYADLYPNTLSSIAEGYQVLRKDDIYETKIEIDSYAAEYMIDDSFRSILINGEPLLCLKDKMVLVEFPLNFENLETESILFDLLIAGYQPVIAHPERYSYMHHSNANYERLKDMGCYLQINFLSLSGYYGSEIKSQGEKLLKSGLIDFIGTDLHHFDQILVLEKLLVSKNWQKWANYPFLNTLLLP